MLLRAYPHVLTRRGVDRSRVSRTGRRGGRRHCDIRDRGSSHEKLRQSTITRYWAGKTS